MEDRLTKENIIWRDTNKMKMSEETQNLEGEKHVEQVLINENPKLEGFDWRRHEQGDRSAMEYSDEDLDKLYDTDFVATKDRHLTMATVVSIDKREVVLDLKGKAQGIISASEFRYNTELKIGDEVEVYVLKQEDRFGHIKLSHKKARIIKAWERVNKLHETQEVVEGFVMCRTKGGMIVDIFGIEAFLPGSQIDVKPIRDYDQFVNKTMEFKVVKINHDFRNVVVSHKALIEADIEEQKKEIVSVLQKGQVLEGVVKNITSYGVFIDLGGVDGLVHITDLSWNRISHPEEVVELDQKINVVILEFDEAKSRIQLGLKQLTPHPWDTLDQNLKIGDRVKGKVVVIADYGAFIEIAPGIEGLIHVSEMSWSTHLRSAQDFVTKGQEIEAEILTLDREERKMSLGIKQLSKDPWADIATKYPVDSKHTGIVRNFTGFGIFVEMEEGVDGLVHISDLSWTQKIKFPSEFTTIGADMEIVVLDIDAENRKLSLGHKQIKENPWSHYEETFGVNTIHKGLVADVFSKGAIVKFEENSEIEAYVPQRLLLKENGTPLQKGETEEFVVIEFNKELKRIVLSHVATYKKEAREEIEQGKNQPQSKPAPKTNQKNEMSTLGDLEALVEIKEKLQKK